MKITTTILGVFLLVITSVNAQWSKKDKKIDGNGQVITKTRNISDYDHVLIAGNMDVEFVSGEEGTVIIKGESNLIPYLKTEVNGASLKIYFEKGYSISTSRNTKLLVTVSFTDLEEVALSGSGNVSTKKSIKANSFSTSLSGSGSIKLLIEASKIFVNIKGSGNVSLEGNTEKIECNITGSGDLGAYDLNSKTANASVIGSGGIKINVADKLVARVIGSGDIDYKGNPEKEDKKVVGSGDITSR